jgi:cyclase
VSVRLIARLDIKNDTLIKSVKLEGLRVVGNPTAFAKRYAADGVDELLYIDAVASLYGRNSLLNFVEATAQHIFVPLTVGGGVRSVEDANALLRAGADKIAINTHAVKNPGLISEMAETFGRQCMVLSLQAKRREGDARGWVAFVENGREPTGLDAIEWAKQAEQRGAGEILLTSIDREGTRRGFDIDLVAAVTSAVSIPVIASGGAGSPEDVVEVVRRGKASAVAVADLLHYDRATIGGIRRVALEQGVNVRRVTS